MDEKSDLFGIMRELLKVIKHKTKKGEYQIFPPDGIEVLGKNKIRYKEVSGQALNLKECLRQLGVTIYHLATGKSELNAGESAMIDKFRYEPNGLDDELWEKISYLLSGNAYNLARIEDMVSWRQQAWKSLRVRCAVVLGRWSAVWSVLSSGILAKITTAKNRIDAMLENHIGKLSMACVAIGALIAGFTFFPNLKSISNVVLVLLVGVFAAALFILNLLIQDTSYDERRQARLLKRNKILIVLMIILIILYAGTSFVYFTEEFGGNGPHNVVAIDNKTGEVAYRLSKNKINDDGSVAWKIGFINRFRYNLIEGINSSGSITLKLSIAIGISDINYPLSFKLHYAIDDANYAEYMKKYKNQSKLEEMICREFEDKALHSIGEKMRSRIKEKLTLTYGDIVVDQITAKHKENLQADLIEEARAGLKKISLPGISLELEY